MADDADPPRQFFRLKPKEFERVNEPAAPSGAEMDPAAAPADQPVNPPRDQRIDVREIFAQAAVPGNVLRRPEERRTGENEVHTILRENHARAEAAGLNRVTPPKKRRSRRWRDYLLSMIVVNGFLGIWAINGLATRNPYTIVYGVGGIVLFSTGFTWVMFAIMDDY
jgi:hypothetical protein